MPFLHGSQGCATYMRRYIISHFREPMDIASSSLGEKQAVYGGGPNLKQGLGNVMNKYGARLIGVATTCLTETIGDDVPGIVREFRQEESGDAADRPAIVTVSTPSYSGTHMEGFHAAVKAVVEQLAEAGEPTEAVNLLPGFVSPADIRYLKEVLEDFGLPGIILPDISETLDGPAQLDYEKIPAGGTPLAEIKAMGRSRATLEFGRTLFSPGDGRAIPGGSFRRALPSTGNAHRPAGDATASFKSWRKSPEKPTPPKHALERGRLIDAYVDGHKYIFDKRAVVYGEEDLVVGLDCLPGGDRRKAGALRLRRQERPLQGGDSRSHRRPAAGAAGSLGRRGFLRDRRGGRGSGPGSAHRPQQGLPPGQALEVPLIRVGFPIHDRFGGQRILHLGYRGAQNLLDLIVNAVIERKQETCQVGYGYI